MTDTLDYRDDTAELALLGAALDDPRITAAIKVKGSDFGQGFLGSVWEAMRAAHAAGESPDLSTLGNRIDGNRRQLAALLPELVGAGMAMNAEHYAATIMDRSQRRRMDIALVGLRNRLAVLDMPVEDIVALAERELIGTGAVERVADEAMTLDEFCDQDIPDADWVISDLLARGERLVLTGVEGFGKTTLLRAIAVCVAAGLDPFTLRSAEPRRVLYVDCENPVGIMARKLGDIRRVIRIRSRDTGTRFWVKRYPQGMDLANPRDRLELHHLCTAFTPDLLVIGPAYKLYIGGAGAREEDLARQVTSALDVLREEFGFALLLEHHSPHASPGSEVRTVRPIGSSLWLRWPEFGMGLRRYEDPDEAKYRRTRGLPPDNDHRVADLVAWRGAREERPWPTRLESGGPDGLPWIDPTRIHR